MDLGILYFLLLIRLNLTLNKKSFILNKINDKIGNNNKYIFLIFNVLEIL